MYQLLSSKLKSKLSLLESCNIPTMVFGSYGIGKSQMIFQWAKNEMAQKKYNRIFLDWNRTSDEIKDDALIHPEKYYVFVDIRISQIDSTDLRGLPNLVSNKDFLDLIPLKWIKIITKENAAGCVFFDEINLAAPLVSAAAYSIINDKFIADSPISKDVFIIAAGNTIKDTSLVQDLPKPLLDRLAAFEMQLDKEYWLSEFAAENINPFLYAFLNWKKDWIHQTCDNEYIKDSTPRGIEKASKLISKVDFDNKKEIYDLLSITVGEAFAAEFQGYYNYFHSLNWDDLLKNPETVEDMKLELQYAILGGALSQLKAFEEKGKFKTLDSFFINAAPYLKVLCHIPRSEMLLSGLLQMKAIKVTTTTEENAYIIFQKLVMLYQGKYAKVSKEVSKLCMDIYGIFSKNHKSVLNQFATLTKI